MNKMRFTWYFNIQLFTIVKVYYCQGKLMSMKQLALIHREQLAEF